MSITKVFTDPSKISKLSKEKLIELFSVTREVLEELTTQDAAIKAELDAKLEGNGEVIGDHTVTRAKRFTPHVTLSEARELGAVKPSIDNSVLKDIYNKGGLKKKQYSITEYLLIKKIKKEEE